MPEWHESDYRPRSIENSHKKILGGLQCKVNPQITVWLQDYCVISALVSPTFVTTVMWLLLQILLNLTIIELPMCVCVCVCVCVWQSTPRTADATVTKIAGYVRVRILMNR